MEKNQSDVALEYVSDEDFGRILKAERPDLAPSYIERAHAAQVKEKSGAVRTLLNPGTFPPEFLPYFETHIRSEIDMKDKKGFNLVTLARKHAKALLKEMDPRMKEIRIDRLFETFVSEHRFDFKHEFAVWKEYRHADSDGALDDHHSFVMSLKETEQKKYADNLSVFREIRNDMAIRQSVLDKIKTGSKHRFNKRLYA